MTEPALLLMDGSASGQERRVGRVLRFFGVSSRNVPAAELAFSNPTGGLTSRKPRVLCSAEVFLRVIESWEQRRACKQWWTQSVHSAFIYSDGNQDALQRLARILTGDDKAVIHPIDTSAGDFAVSHKLADFCEVMANMRVAANKANTNGNFVLCTAKRNVANIISVGDMGAFLTFEHKGVPVFLSSSREIIDLDAALKSEKFDVRDHFLSAVPLVLYIKWAFAETCWNAPETNACLVIDDPVLKPRHGFVNFQELLSLMKRHNFTTNIAFIPWNWRRSAPEVVRLLRENPQNYSVSVHGCDHIRAEFGSSDRQRLYWKTQQALGRMNRHETTTGIHYDPVMVFPQGVFSEAAMSALKRTPLIAAVNNDIITADPNPRVITISDVWDIAVMAYSFPLFTRRYPWEGIENFVFDALLGKPAIIVVHHDYCSDHCSRLIDFVDQLNALNCPPTWRNLGEVVRRSCRQRNIFSTEVEVEMYGAELCIENFSEQPKRFLIRRREREPSAIREICDRSGSIAWNCVNGHINFEIELSPGQSNMIGIRFHELAGNGYNGDNLPYRFKAMLRRYLCEVRDNYITTTKMRLADLMSR
jgi:peptidoglycan/xylan/chitin deacetylase (PgdA/CDA1 family)